MNQPGVGSDVIDAGSYSVTELRRMVFSGKGPLSRPLALSLLGRKRYPSKTKDLERLLVDDGEEPRLRNMAAVELGRIGDSEAAAVLQQSLRIKEELTLRGVIEGLGLARIDRVPAAVRRLATREGPVGETARRAALLISHRAGTPEVTTARPQTRIARLPGGADAPIEIATPRRAEVADALATVATITPAVALTDDGATAFICRNRTIMFLLATVEGRGLDVAEVLRRKMQIGVVASRVEIEGRRWGVTYHVLTEPTGPRSIGIRMTSAKGRLMLEGTAQVSGERATFEIRSVGGPGALDVAVEGAFDGRHITFRNVRGSLFRQASLEPSPFQRYRTAAIDESPSAPSPRANRKRAPRKK